MKQTVVYHVIAATVFLDEWMAHWTLFDEFRQILERGVVIIVFPYSYHGAWNWLMWQLRTFEAKQATALACTCEVVYWHCACLYDQRTFWRWTPVQQVVGLKWRWLIIIHKMKTIGDSCSFFPFLWYGEQAKASSVYLLRHMNQRWCVDILHAATAL